MDYQILGFGMRGSKILSSLKREIAAVWRWCVLQGYRLSDIIFLDFGAGAMNLVQHLGVSFPSSDISDIIGISTSR